MSMPSINRRSFISGTTAALSLGYLSSGYQFVNADDSNKTIEQPGKTPNTRFAVNVEMWWTKLPFMQRLQKAVEFGYPAVEFWPFQDKDLPAIAKYCDETGLQVSQFTAWGFSPSMCDPAQEANVEKQIIAACAAAKQINCHKMCVVAGDNVEGMTQEQMHDQVIKALKRVAPILEDNNVMAILEPMNERVDHPGHCLYGSADGIKICKAVDSPMVKLNWDLYHMQITEGDLCGHLKDGFDCVGYLQLADHPGRHEPGTGEVHYNRVLKAAKELGYNGFVGLECVPQTDELTAAMGVYQADIW